MKLTVFPILVAALLSSCAQPDKPPNLESRLPGNCHAIGRAEPICAVGFADLATRPELYSGKLIRIQGFAAVDAGFVTLFESESDFEYQNRRKSVEIGCSEHCLSQFVSTHAYHYVSLVARFDGRFEDALALGRAGKIRSPDHVFQLKRSVDRSRNFTIHLSDLEK